MTAMENTLLTVNPTFTILDWEKAEPILLKCLEGTKAHDGCIYYGFIKNGEIVECREAWTNAAVLKDHIEGEKGIGSVMGALVEPGIATLDAMYVTGPKEELDVALKVFEAFGCVGYETMSGGFTNMKSFTGDEMKPNTFITVHPTFTILDWEKAQPILDKCNEGTKEHGGNIYYGMVKRGDTVKCRECWADAASLKEHIEGEKGIGSVMGALLEPGVGKMDSIFVAAPPDQLDDTKKIFEAFGCDGFVIHSGFSRFSM